MIEQTPEREPWNTGHDFKFQLLNINQIVDDPTIHMAIRNLAATLIENYSRGIYYRSTGAFFWGLPNYMLADLFSMQQGFKEEYLEWISNTSLKKQYNLKNLTCLAFLLARAEGMTEMNTEVLKEVLPQLCKLIQQDSTARKQGKTVDHVRMSVLESYDECRELKE